MIPRLLALIASAVIAAGALAQDGTKLAVKEGDKFPDLAVKAVQIDKVLKDKTDAKTLQIADLKGRTVVVFFYPKAMTPG